MFPMTPKTDSKFEKQVPFTPAQLDVMRDAYSPIQTIPTSAVRRMQVLIASLSDANLDLVIEAGIKFMSKVAVNEKARRSNPPTPHLLDLIAKASRR